MTGPLKVFALALIVVVVSVFANAGENKAQAHAGSHPAWSYRGAGGPGHWGDLQPAYAACKNGTRQAPIDIRAARPAKLEPIQFKYKPMPLTIVDNGHTIQVQAASGGGIVIGGTHYSLVQFHFHRPSEEAIGSKRFEMVAHLVNRDAAGHLAVVAVLFQQGEENKFIQSLWSNLPHQGAEYSPKGVTIDLSGLLPADRNYYTFDGSLTTPPCGEGVKWYVLKSPVTISAAQLATFAKLYPDNARPLQPVNGRQILESDFSKH